MFDIKETGRFIDGTMSDTERLDFLTRIIRSGAFTQTWAKSCGATDAALKLVKQGKIGKPKFRSVPTGVWFVTEWY